MSFVPTNGTEDGEVQLAAELLDFVSGFGEQRVDVPRDFVIGCRPDRSR